MKSGGPLKRTTPLAGGKPLARKTPLVAKQQPPKPRSTLPKPTQPIKQVSEKRAVENRERAAIKRADLAGEQPPCQRCQLVPAVDWHERLSRGRGGSITDRENRVWLCRPCHDWVTTNPAAAEAEGWALPSPTRQRVERAT